MNTRTPFTYPTALLIIILIGAALRIHYLERPIYTDEAYTYLYFVRDGWRDVLTDYREPNNHIFQTILAWASVTHFDHQPYALRLPALASGILLLPLVYIAGARLYTPSAGLIAAGFTAVSVPLAEYAVNARGYSFIALFFALLVILAADFKRGSSNQVGRALAYGIVAALGLYTVPIMLYPLGAVSLWVVLSVLLEHRGVIRWQRLGVFAMGLTFGAWLTVLLYTPIIRTNGLDAVIGNRFVLSLSPEAFRQTVINFPGEFLAYIAQGMPHPLYWLLSIFAGIAIIFHRFISQDRIPLILPTAIWLTVLVIIQYVLPPIRTWIFLVVLWCLLTGAGLALIFRWLRLATWVPLVSVMLVLMFSVQLWQADALNHTVTYKVEPDAEPTAAYLTTRLQPADRILLTNGAIHNFEYYLDAYGHPFNIVYLTDQISPDENAQQTARDATLYVLTRVGDPHVDDRIRESVGINIHDPDYTLLELAVMPNNEIVIQQLIVEGS